MTRHAKLDCQGVEGIHLFDGRRLCCVGGRYYHYYYHCYTFDFSEIIFGCPFVLFRTPAFIKSKNIYVCYMTHILCYFQFWFSPLSSKIQTLASINPVYIYVLEIYNSITHLINRKLLKNCNIRSMSHECVVILECGAVLKKWLCVTVTSACYYCYYYYERLLSLSFVFLKL